MLEGQELQVLEDQVVLEDQGHQVLEERAVFQPTCRGSRKACHSYSACRNPYEVVHAGNEGGLDKGGCRPITHDPETPHA